jgi:hypothetical protein
MQAESYGASTRTRIAPNLYRWLNQDGSASFAVMFKDVDGRQRQRVLDATSEREAIREGRAILASRDGGERQVPPP